MSWDLQGRTVFITGAARGIGADSARRLAARGANVALVGLEPEELRRVAADIGPAAAAFDADVTDVDTLNRAVEGVVARFGGIDAVVANAGIAPVGTVLTIDPEAFERTIEVNLLGVWRTVRATLPHVIERRGYVLCVASVAAAVHGPLMAHYSASKAGTEAFAQALRSEVAHKGTRVGVAYFSFIDTDMVRDAFSHPATRAQRDAAPSWLTKPLPLSAAGKAIEKGVAERADRVVAPRWARGVLALRNAIPAIESARASRDPVLRETIRAAEAAATSGAAPAAAQVPERGR